MVNTGEIAADVGTVVYGEETVQPGLIGRVGGLSDALGYIHEGTSERKGQGTPENGRPLCHV